jgi:hypothetical protein
MQMRVLSLVPKDIGDIRDAFSDSFADVAARRFRATTAYTVAAVLFAFAAVLFIVAVVRVFGRVRQRKPAAARVVPT